jgi:hypothetical protein
VLRIIQRFGKHCSCHLQGDYVMIGLFLEALGGELDLMVLTGGAE